MLRVSIKDSEQLVHSEGTLTGLLVDVSYVIGVLYGRIKMSSPEKAEAFRRMLIQSLIEPKSPVWNYDPAQSSGFSACIPIKKRRIKS